MPLADSAGGVYRVPRALPGVCRVPDTRPRHWRFKTQVGLRPGFFCGSAGYGAWGGLCFAEGRGLGFEKIILILY